MSVNTIERILWEFGEEPERVTDFLADPDSYLSRYQLTDEEFNMVKTLDVKAFDEYGVSNMLGLMSWSAVNGNNPFTMFDYLKRMNNDQLPNNMQLPGVLFNIMLFAVGVRRVLVKLLRLFGVRKSLY